MSISTGARTDVFAQEGGGFLVCLTINHDSLAQPICVVNNTVDIVSNSVAFSAFPFTIVLPEDKDGSVPRSTLVIDNVSREIAQLIRSITTPPSVLIQVVRIDDLDSVELSLPTFQLRNVTWDALSVQGDLMIDDIEKEPFPQRSMTPAEYPGLF